MCLPWNIHHNLYKLYIDFLLRLMPSVSYPHTQLSHMEEQHHHIPYHPIPDIPDIKLGLVKLSPYCHENGAVSLLQK